MSVAQQAQRGTKEGKAARVKFSTINSSKVKEHESTATIKKVLD